MGDGFNLTCPFEHFNRCEWLKNGESFNNNRTIIDFQHVAISDTGIVFSTISNLPFSISSPSQSSPPPSFSSSSSKLRYLFVFYMSLSGNYTCRCSNEAGENEYTYQLLVHYSPIIQDPSINDGIFDVMLAKNFSFDCQASGYPLPSVSNTMNEHLHTLNFTIFFMHFCTV